MSCCLLRYACSRFRFCACSLRAIGSSEAMQSSARSRSSGVGRDYRRAVEPITFTSDRAHLRGYSRQIRRVDGPVGGIGNQLAIGGTFIAKGNPPLLRGLCGGEQENEKERQQVPPRSTHFFLPSGKTLIHLRMLTTRVPSS